MLLVIRTLILSAENGLSLCCGSNSLLQNDVAFTYSPECFLKDDQYLSRKKCSGPSHGGEIKFTIFRYLSSNTEEHGLKHSPLLHLALNNLQIPFVSKGLVLQLFRDLNLHANYKVYTGFGFLLISTSPTGLEPVPLKKIYLCTALRRKCTLAKSTFSIFLFFSSTVNCS